MPDIAENNLTVATSLAAADYFRAVDRVSTTPRSVLITPTNARRSLDAPLEYPAKYSGAGWFHGSGSGISTVAMTQSRLNMIPFYIWESGTIDALSVEVTTGVASSTVRLGLYSDSGDFRPNTNGGLLVDAGSIDGNVTGHQSITGLNVPVVKGQWIWFGQCSQGGNPTVRVFSQPILPRINYGSSLPGVGGVNGGYRLESITGALPNTTALTSLLVNFLLPRFFFRLT